MKTLKSKGLSILGAGFALFAGHSASAQFSGTSFTPLYTPATNAWTYVQPSTPVGFIFIPSQQIVLTAAAFTTSNTVTVPINLGIDPAMSNYPITLCVLTNTSSNGVFVVTTAATNLNIYAQAIIKMTNTITGQVGIQAK